MPTRTVRYARSVLALSADNFHSKHQNGDNSVNATAKVEPTVQQPVASEDFSVEAPEAATTGE
ncbi:hypothetical protein F442_11847 [Phytophthora nicotianae P10297]|uniref:Uncharacterized protein n=2 Tax=Phytophthora nicotianae TaxID=4792 RepID=W2Z1F2_PHYNI|nr:hypothetical protein L915_11643 [Phytophthora nicotianae]ETL36460.1 hypothetical protein L916_11561 [Phytophthora nicotianae]ETP40885.1 hypothetical protein F442_11847 [Phytophthora nicotianae P10297]